MDKSGMGQVALFFGALAVAGGIVTLGNQFLFGTTFGYESFFIVVIAETIYFTIIGIVCDASGTFYPKAVKGNTFNDKQIKKFEDEYRQVKEE